MVPCASQAGTVSGGSHRVKASPAGMSTAGDAPRPLEPILQSTAGPRQPRQHRAAGAAQPLRRRLGAQALEIVQHDRGAEPLGEPVDLGEQRGIVGFGFGGDRCQRTVSKGRPLDARTARDGDGVGPPRRGPAPPPAGRSRPASRPPSPSGGPSRPCSPARRNVAWKASWASCGSPSSRRQTLSTIAPCRSTSAVNAASDADRVVSGQKAFQELAIGQAAGRAQAVERAELTGRRTARSCTRHRGSPSSKVEEILVEHHERMPRAVRPIPGFLGCV